MTLSCTLKIGPCRLRFLCPSRGWKTFLEKEYRPFLAPGQPGKAMTVSLRSAPAEHPSFPDDPVVLSAAGTMEIKRFDFESVSDKAFRKTSLSVHGNKYSFNSWLRVFMTLCGQKKSGLLVHGAGIYLCGGVYLFPGRSGSGKSTITRILGKRNALSDELVFIHRRRGKPVAESTPFWGELKKGSGKVYSGPVRGLFFLRHGKKIELESVAPGEAVKRLMKTILFFSEDAARMDGVLRSAADLAVTAPAFTLTFAKDSSARDIAQAIERQL